jgi:hypothetical protein
MNLIKLYVYETTERGVVHLVDEYDPAVAPKTLCGRSTHDMTTGDESPSGIAATCGGCRRVAKLPVQS